jgi:hypothetical protein
VPNSCFPICSYRSDTNASPIGCAVSGTTLTAISGTNGDMGTVAFFCF